MQLSRSGHARGFVATGIHIVKRETPLALYKGLGAVLSGIVPKMAIRFASFETYKGWLGKNSVGTIFLGVYDFSHNNDCAYSVAAGLAAGVTEAVTVVTPMEVIKIRLQAQQHSLADPLEKPRYRNAGHAVYTVVREEGISTLYRGVTLTALRQATNQGLPYWLLFFARPHNALGANFTAYQELKKLAHHLQPDLAQLPSYQHMLIGLISGAMGPFSNAPIDTIKTRVYPRFICSCGLFICISRSTKIHSCAWPVLSATHYGHCQRHVEDGGCAVFLQRHHTTCIACCAWAGYCVCSV